VTTATQTPVVPGTETPCQNAESRRDDVAKAQRRIIDDENDIDAALKTRDVNLATQQASVDGARRDLTVAQNKAGLASSNRPFDITVLKAKLDQAEADVVAAQKALDATIMKSSFSGIVDRINGSVGQAVTAASYSPVDSNQSAAPQPGGGPFIVLKNVKSFQVMVPFSAADASRMEPNQAVEVTFDAISGLALKGTLASIDPTETNNSTGVTSDLVTVFLTELDPRLKDGMTAQAHVILGKVENALIVPSAAVRGSNGRTGTVTVVQTDGTHRDVLVELGAVGDETTQVVSTSRSSLILPRRAQAHRVPAGHHRRHWPAYDEGARSHVRRTVI